MPATMPQIADVMISPWPAGRTAFERLRRESGHPIERAADFEEIGSRRAPSKDHALNWPPCLYGVGRSGWRAVGAAEAGGLAPDFK